MGRLRNRPKMRIATDRRGDKVNFVVKRQIPGLTRKYVVALIARAKQASV
jgi:hypothetical protein